MSELGALLAVLDSFHITDRALCRARDAAKVRGDGAAESALRREMRRYFSAVERESVADLAAIDRKLDDLYQRQFNLHAERSVAERRLAAARAALDDARAVAERKA